jgi:Flp pilus assembly protein TadG
MLTSFVLDRARRRMARLAGRFARADGGATTVELAFTAIPFLMLVFAIIELGLVYLVSLTLDNAVIDVGRTIRTGQFQNASGTAATFKASVCQKMSWLGSNCSGALAIDVQTYSDFASTTDSSNSGSVPKTMKFDAGKAGSIVLVRAYYTWPLITPLLKTGLQNSNGKRIVYSATAFTNEPYDQ